MGGADPGDVQLVVDYDKRVRALSDVVAKDIAELYRMGEQLGEGRFSTVHAGEAVNTGKRFALKVVDNKTLNDEENLEALEQEVRILRMLEHPYVVKLKEVVMTNDATYMCMELLAGGELFGKIVEQGPYPEAPAAVLFAKLVIGVEFLHSKQVVHRDLKPENVLFVSGAGEQPTDIKIIDFGYAGIWTASAQLTGLCGTPDYVSPEVISWYDEEAAKGRPYGKASDVWSMGVLLYVLLSGCSPFAAEEEEELLRLVEKAEFSFPEKEWAKVSDSAKDVVRRCLVVNEAERVTIAQLKQHDWCREAIQAAELELQQSGALNPRGGKGGKGGKGAAEAAEERKPCCVLQ
eukprot:CAMPEP_0119405748 /NCGR_PEP_ID=MMETSP1335-20130426/335_1 /TAXON_ID=259385 /ORGANISM="Chrysoculter rhomboideus, Strain RCC1486" /LENGTH=347 /DNA_ID=CAMNT_0007429789 /DNA_START=100 /DNA_END=1143 /DNA_ORIENTATION=-